MKQFINFQLTLFGDNGRDSVSEETLVASPIEGLIVLLPRLKNSSSTLTPARSNITRKKSAGFLS